MQLRTRSAPDATERLRIFSASAVFPRTCSERCAERERLARPALLASVVKPGIGNELIVKRVVRDREAGWLLVSENPDKKAFPIQTWPDDARAIAEVNWHGQSFRSNSEPREPNLTKCSDQRGADFRVERESVGPARTRIRIRVGRRP